jgi:hypothetical protein
MYINITEVKLGDVLMIECFLSQYGYDSEIKRKNRKTVMNIMKPVKTSKPCKELCSLIREVG